MSASPSKSTPSMSSWTPFAQANFSPSSTSSTSIAESSSVRSGAAIPSASSSPSIESTIASQWVQELSEILAM